MARQNYIYLLSGLLVLLAVAPALRGHESLASVIIPISFSASMLLGVWSLFGRWFLLGLFLAVVVTALSISEILFGVAVRLPLLVVTLSFVLVTGWQSGRDVLFGGEIDANRLTGAVCIYLMLGLGWALLYALLELLVPGSFNGVDIAVRTSFWEFVYFSFVTITTLGYGDVTPELPFAEVLAYMEAIVGQFYMAILVATLVGAHLSRRVSAASDKLHG